MTFRLCALTLLFTAAASAANAEPILTAGTSVESRHNVTLGDDQSWLQTFSSTLDGLLSGIGLALDSDLGAVGDILVKLQTPDQFFTPSSLYETTIDLNSLASTGFTPVDLSRVGIWVDEGDEIGIHLSRSGGLGEVRWSVASLSTDNWPTYGINAGTGSSHIAVVDLAFQAYVDPNPVRVPEPSGTFLLGIAGAVLTAFRRRRQPQATH